MVFSGNQVTRHGGMCLILQSGFSGLDIALSRENKVWTPTICTKSDVSFVICKETTGYTEEISPDGF